MILFFMCATKFPPSALKHTTKLTLILHEILHKGVTVTEWSFGQIWSVSADIVATAVCSDGVLLLTLCWPLHVLSRLPWKIDWQAYGSPCLCHVGPCHLPFCHHLGYRRVQGCVHSHDDHHCHSSYSEHCICWQKVQKVASLNGKQFFHTFITKTNGVHIPNHSLMIH